jgi:hypothetical protein
MPFEGDFRLNSEMIRGDEESLKAEVNDEVLRENKGSFSRLEMDFFVFASLTSSRLRAIIFSKMFI